MSPPTSSADKPPFAAVQNPSQWRFSWEAQSHTSTLRLLLFNPNVKPSAQCRDLELNLLPQHSLLMVSFSGSEETRNRTSVWVPVPRVLIDPESPLHFRAFDDHIEVKLVLLLPVDHPLVSEFDSILNVEENKDELCPLSMDSDLKKLSCMEEVHLYCRNCSTKLTKSLRCFEEMPSVNWRESADNWFGNCCCSFGGLSEELVAKYAKSYACAPGVCLLNTTSVLLCINDILGCELPDVKTRQKFESELNSPSKRCLSKVSHEVCEQVQVGCCGNHDGRVPDIIIKSSIAEPNIADNLESETSKEVVKADNLSYTFPAFKIEENKGLMNEISQIVDCDSRCCTPDVLGTSSMVQMNRTKDEHLENQKIFLDGFLGNGFMVRSSGLSKDIRWTEFLCPQCSCLIGTYPCVEDNVSLDGGVRLFKCYISSCIPSNGTNDAFRAHPQCWRICVGDRVRH
ncbi:hypothetical protein ACJIZ3_002126 [Penstemon smallii]|uniref:Uncharacterized protein n=1 Tax=Penstemon smallii TaxID=265156 RepID=A0ABD3U8C3_9LAMI